jgi:AcrR family transcriptional regulator
MANQPYHHGDLRRALLDAAAPLIAEVGPANASLRELARRTGVSHTAPAHHFGDKTGLLTAVATEGFTLLADRLAEAARRTHSFLEVGVAYVRFALDQPAHFATMFRADLLHGDEPDLVAARARANAVLRDSLAEEGHDLRGEAPTTALAAWSLVHGFASLWSAGAIRPGAEQPDDPEELARAVAKVLLRGTPALNEN